MRMGDALSIRSIANICERWLGVSTVHSLRHTFARGMEDAGAKVSDIQARLGQFQPGDHRPLPSGAQAEPECAS
jgi:integrase